MPPTDVHGRPLRNLRISVTDRCNLRCAYCMPEEDYTWLPREDLLTFEEIGHLVDAFIDNGVTRIRLTGGEPMLRKDLPALVEILGQRADLRDIALTTNGVLLGEHAAALHGAGLHRVTVSLDTLRPEVFRELCRRDDLDAVLTGLDATRSAGFQGTKIDTVVMRGTNDGELVDLLALAREVDAEIRFIEYMDVGGATRWSMDRVVSRDDMLARIGAELGAAEPIRENSSAPADRYRLPSGQVFGIIASTTAPFCSACDRSRLTADGMWLRCLYARTGTDLRGPLRAGSSREQLAALLAETWRGRTDRGAEDRLAERGRSPLVQIEDLRKNPHLEMHTRGG